MTCGIGFALCALTGTCQPASSDAPQSHIHPRFLFCAPPVVRALSHAAKRFNRATPQIINPKMAAGSSQPKRAGRSPAPELREAKNTPNLSWQTFCPTALRTTFDCRIAPPDAITRQIRLMRRDFPVPQVSGRQLWRAS